MARLLFLNEEFAARLLDREQASREVVGHLRMTAGREPNHPELRELVGELAVRSSRFRTLWAEHHVHQKASGGKPLQHPEVGLLDLHYATLLTPGWPNQMLQTYAAEPGTPTAERLASLGSLAVAGESRTGDLRDARSKTAEG